MVNFTTFYKDIGTTQQAEIITIMVTMATNVTIADLFGNNVVSDMLKISNQCKYALFTLGYVSYLGGYFTQNKLFDETVRTINGPIPNTYNVLVLTSQTAGNYTDVFNLCTTAQFRSIGPMNEKRRLSYYKPSGEFVEASITQIIFDFAIDVILNLNPYNTLSVGVLFTDPYFEATVKVYARAGFINPKISKNMNVRPSAVPFLKMDTRDGLQKLNKDMKANTETIRKALAIGKKFLQANTYIIQIEIPKRVNDYIQTQLITLPEETGSAVALAHVDGNRYKFVYPCVLERRTMGGPGVLPFAYPPSTSIELHTHPIICHVMFDCKDAWPSGLDSMSFLSQSIKKAVDGYPYLQIVASKDGYYTQQVSQYFFDSMRIGFKLTYNPDKFIPTHMFSKFIVNFTHIHTDYLEIERRNQLSTAASNYEYIRRMNQVSLADMFNHYFAMIDRLIYFYNYANQIYISYLSTLANSVEFYKFVLSLYDQIEFYRYWSQLDIIRLVEFAITDPNMVYPFLLASKERGQTEFIDPIIEECKANNIDIFEPFYISTFVDDFVVNPNIESASFTYYNYDTSKQGASNIMSLQEATRVDNIVKQLANVDDKYMVNVPPPLSTTIDKLQSFTTFRETGSCDPSFYSNPVNSTVGQLV